MDAARTSRGRRGRIEPAEASATRAEPRHVPAPLTQHRAPQSGTRGTAAPHLGTAAPGAPGTAHCYPSRRCLPPLPLGARLRTWLTRLVFLAIGIVATIVVGGALDARRRHPELSWSGHRLVPSAEVTAADLGASGHARGVPAPRRWGIRSGAPRDRAAAARVGADRGEPVQRAGHRARPACPGTTTARSRLSRPRWRRGAARPRAERSPYSMRALAERPGRGRVHALALRMQATAGARRAHKCDVDGWWPPCASARDTGAAGTGPAVRDGRLLERRRAPVKYALDAVDSPEVPSPDRLILFSPMIGVTPSRDCPPGRRCCRRFRISIARLARCPAEYNPFKFNSFPRMPDGRP